MSNNLFDLNGRVAIVTGTSRGLDSNLRVPWQTPALISCLRAATASICSLSRQKLSLLIDARFRSNLMSATLRASSKWQQQQKKHSAT